jgi:hypothetical protein
MNRPEGADAMKIAYGIATLFLLLGVWLLTAGVTDNEHVTLLGITLYSRVARGVGIISLILGIVAFLAAYGGSLPTRPVGRRQ